MRADNSPHLAEAARRRSEQTTARARQALADMQHSGQPVTIAAVAARAGISRSWLYTQAELRQQISTLRGASTIRVAHAATPASDSSLRQRLALAHQRIRDLSDDNQQLRDQIAALHGRLRATRLTGSSVTDNVHDTKAQANQPNGQNDRR
jgi:hypothetical protein